MENWVKACLTMSVFLRSTSESHEIKSRGSVASLGSSDSRGNEEEVVISYQEEAVDIADTGAGNQDVDVEDLPLRLVIISSKLRNTTAVRHALQSNVVLVQYKYDSSTLEGILSKFTLYNQSLQCTTLYMYTCLFLDLFTKLIVPDKLFNIINKRIVWFTFSEDDLSG